VRLQFQQLGPWYGRGYTDWELDDGHFLDDGLYLDSAALEVTLDTNPKVFTVTNNGNLTTGYIILSYAVSTVAMSALHIVMADAASTPGVELNWDGAVFAATELVIDNAEMSVLNNGADAYDDLHLDTNHRIGRWLQFVPGDNQVGIQRVTGGSATDVVRVEYREAWA
jgi:hypothetical protein